MIKKEKSGRKWKILTKQFREYLADTIFINYERVMVLDKRIFIPLENIEYFQPIKNSVEKISK
ncbi:MAG: hypothetical protein ACTSWK_00380 [Promethearchaeota archaeon]